MLSLDYLSIDRDRQSSKVSKSHRSIKNKGRKRSRKNKSSSNRRSKNGKTTDQFHHTSDVCAVCLSNNAMDTMLLPCNHVFHGDCISQWVRQNFSCPLCRQEIKQFIPLKANRNRAIQKEFEQLWVAHYFGTNDNAETTDGKPLSPIPEHKFTSKIAHPTIEIVSSPAKSLWSYVWHDMVATPSNRSRAMRTLANCVDVVMCASPTIPLVSPYSYLVEGDHLKPMDKQGQQLSSSSSQLDSMAEGLVFGTTSVRYWTPPASPSSIPAEVVSEPLLERASILSDTPISDAVTMAVEMTTSLPKSKLGYKDLEVSEKLSVNMRAGIVAGGVAAVGTYIPAVTLNRTSWIAARSLVAPIIRDIAPTIAIFFTTYEHIKAYLFHTDAEMNSRSRTFAERYVAAGIAGSLASVTSPRTSPLVSLRFAAFFSGFELFKDIRSDFIQRRRPLNVTEVAASAAVGGTIASAVYYPSTNIVRSAKLRGAVTGVPAFAADVALLWQRQSFRLLTDPRPLYSGFGRHLAMWLPSCVGCSCAFEFARRYFVNKQ